MNNVLPLVSGQASVLQERYWILLPSQYLPPFFGKGLSQERNEYCTPPPQVREQSPHGPHRPQPPLTGVWNTNKNVELSFKWECAQTLTQIYFSLVSYLLLGSLAFGETLASQAITVMSARCSISPGEVLGLAHQQAIGCGHRAPKSSACGAQIRAMLGVFAKGQSTLVISVIDGTRQGLGQWLGFDWFIQEALAVAIVQEGGDHEGRAGGPGLLLVQVGQGRGHHVGTPVGPVDPRA